VERLRKMEKMVQVYKNFIHRFRKLRRFFAFLICAVCVICGFIPTMAQEDVRLRLSEPDLSNFPEVRLNVLSSDGRGAPLA